MYCTRRPRIQTSPGGPLLALPKTLMSIICTVITNLSTGAHQQQLLALSAPRLKHRPKLQKKNMHNQEGKERDEEIFRPASASQEQFASHDMLDPLLAAGTASLEITLRQHLAGIDQLDDVDILLERHDGGRDDGDDPRYLAVNLVRARHLESTGTPRAGEKTAWRGVGRVAGLGGGWLSVGDRLQEGRRKDRGRERQKVDADEEELVESAADEQDGLECQNQQLVNGRAVKLPTLLW